MEEQGIVIVRADDLRQAIISLEGVDLTDGPSADSADLHIIKDFTVFRAGIEL